jgi:hypothetical protein
MIEIFDLDDMIDKSLAKIDDIDLNDDVEFEDEEVHSNIDTSKIKKTTLDAIMGKFKDNGVIVTVDIIFGIDAVDMVIKPILEGTNDSCEVIAIGESNIDLCERYGIEFSVIPDYYRERHGEVLKIKNYKQTSFAVLFGINFTSPDLLYRIIKEMGKRVILIGDSELVDYHHNGEIINILRNADVVMDYMDKTKTLLGHKLDVISYVHKIKNGAIEELTPYEGRSVRITNDIVSAEEMFLFDAVILPNAYIKNYTEYLRYNVFGHTSYYPSVGERLVAYEEIILESPQSIHDYTYIPYGAEVLVKGKSLEYRNEYIIEYKGKEHTLGLSLGFIDTMSGCSEIGDEEGYKFYYGYCIPASMTLDKTYDKIFYEYDSRLTLNNKRLLYSIFKTAKNNITCLIHSSGKIF